MYKNRVHNIAGDEHTVQITIGKQAAVFLKLRFDAGSNPGKSGPDYK
jgi:hypothetical protein